MRSLRRVTFARVRAKKRASLQGKGSGFTTFSLIFIPVIAELIQQGLFVPPVPAVRYEAGVEAASLHPPGAREISLELKLDLVALPGQDFNSIPVLTNRKIEQQVRLREGEACC